MSEPVIGMALYVAVTILWLTGIAVWVNERRT